MPVLVCVCGMFRKRLHETHSTHTMLNLLRLPSALAAPKQVAGLCVAEPLIYPVQVLKGYIVLHIFGYFTGHTLVG